MNSHYVQFGCGLDVPEGWRNFDASPRLRAEKCPILRRLIRPPLFPDNCEYGDIVKGLPIAPGACDVLYSSHVLEHLSLTDLRAALKNAFVLLKPGGVFRAVLPDLERAANKFVASVAEDRAITFMKATSLGKEKRARGITSWLREALGNSYHLWMWDFRGLVVELRDAGFVEIRQAYYGGEVVFGIRVEG